MSENMFNPGDKAYFMSLDSLNSSIDWFEVKIDHYDPVTGRYCIMLEKGSDGKNCHLVTYQYVETLFKTKQELFHACESYCRLRAVYWQDKAVWFNIIQESSNVSENQ